MLAPDPEARPLERFPASLATAWASERGLTLASRQVGSRVTWKPYAEQVELFELLEKHPALFVAKPRKTGISTASEFIDVCETMEADAAGNRIRTVIVIDNDDKTYEHQAQINDFAQQMGLECKPNDQWLTFPNGSEIVTMTAGGKQPGRGGTIHRLHCTELPFWPDPKGVYKALRTSCIDNPRLIIETTLDPTDPFISDAWHGVDEDGTLVLPEYHRHFWTVQAHQSYRLELVPGRGDNVFFPFVRDGKAATVVLTDAQWKWAQDEGFTLKAAAAWWIYEALANKCAGDVVQLMHDYPQHERHLFQVGASRVIKVTPKVVAPLKVIEVPGIGGDVWRVNVYVPPESTSKQVIFGVDTSRAEGKSNGAIIGIDKRSAEVVCSFAHNRCRGDDLAAIAHVLQKLYEGSDERGRPLTPTVLIEEDGIGLETIHKAERLGMPHERFKQGPQEGKPKGRVEEVITAAKRAIESGAAFGPKELANEANGLREEKSGYVGQKDMIMALGMCMVHRQESGYQMQRGELREREMNSFQEDLRAHLLGRAAQGGRGGFKPPW